VPPRQCRPFRASRPAARGWTNRIELVWGTTTDSPRADGREILDAAFFPLDALPEAITDFSAAHLENWKSRRPQSER
jgi:hypothetical protein